LTGTLGDAGGGLLDGTGTGLASGGSAIADGPTGALGTAVGGVVVATGQTIAVTGASLASNALNSPIGITIAGTSTPGTGAGNIIGATVLSDPASTAPIQAVALTPGKIAGVSVANPETTTIPAVTPLVTGTPAIVASIPGAAPAVGQLGTAIDQNVTPALSGGTAQLDTAAAPLNPLSNVKLGTTQLLGTSGTPALVNAAVATPSSLASASIDQSSGIGASSAGSGLNGLGGRLSGGLTALTGGLTK